jgi:hypothetical protein
MASAMVRAYRESGAEPQQQIEILMILTAILVLRSTILNGVLCPACRGALGAGTSNVKSAKQLADKATLPQQDLGVVPNANAFCAT